MKLCRGILRNPYYPAGGVIAKLATNGVTVLWSMLVLLVDNALSITSYRSVSTYVHEDMIAWVLLVLSIYQIIALCAHIAPNWCSAVGYAGLFGWWLAMLVLVLFGAPGNPNAVAGTALIVVLAAYAFVSGLRTRPLVNHADTD